jgi:hypothetical protein
MSAAEIDAIFASKGELQASASTSRTDTAREKKKKKKKKKKKTAENPGLDVAPSTSQSTMASKRSAPETVLDPSLQPKKKARVEDTAARPNTNKSSSSKKEAARTGDEKRFKNSRGSAKRTYRPLLSSFPACES